VGYLAFPLTAHLDAVVTGVRLITVLADTKKSWSHFALLFGIQSLFLMSRGTVSSGHAKAAPQFIMNTADGLRLQTAIGF
jgi:hypothetical protein